MRAPEVPLAVPPQALGVEEDQEKEEKKLRKKRKKEKKEEDRLLGGKRPGKAVLKPFQDLYAGTGLDQREKVRRRVMRRAKRYAAKKSSKGHKSGSSSSGSSSSSTTIDPDPTAGESVFLEESKTRGLASRFPGALAMDAWQQ